MAGPPARRRPLLFVGAAAVVTVIVLIAQGAASSRPNAEQGVQAYLDQVRPAGLRCLESWLSGQPRPLAARVVLKLPPDLAIDADREVPGSWRDRAGTVLERIARSELAEALPLLASEEA